MTASRNRPLGRAIAAGENPLRVSVIVSDSNRSVGRSGFFPDADGSCIAVESLAATRSNLARAKTTTAVIERDRRIKTMIGR